MKTHIGVDAESGLVQTVRGMAGNVNEVIENRSAEFDIVCITRYSVAERFIESSSRHAPQGEILFINADLHFLREFRSAISARSKDALGHALQTREADLGVMSRVDLVLSYNEIEHAVILSHCLDSSRVAKCPWLVETVTDVPAFEVRSAIAFLGGYSHSPNVEANEYFVREVIPLSLQSGAGINGKVIGAMAHGVPCVL